MCWVPPLTKRSARPPTARNRRQCTAPTRLNAMASRAFPVIYSRSVLESVRFYSALDFVETFRLPPDGEPGYVSLRRGEAELGIVDAQWPRDQLGTHMGKQ